MKSWLKSGFLAKKRTLAVIFCVIAVAVGIWIVLINRAHKPAQAFGFDAIKASVPFVLYYPNDLPSYFFVDRGSVHYAGGIVLFTIRRNDGKTIQVTEQSTPKNFDLNSVNGLQHQITGVGTTVIGTGFQGQSAFIKTSDNTLIILSATNQISQGDLQQIDYGFRPF